MNTDHIEQIIIDSDTGEKTLRFWELQNEGNENRMLVHVEETIPSGESFTPVQRARLLEKFLSAVDAANREIENA